MSRPLTVICPNCHAVITPPPQRRGRKPAAACKRGHPYTDHGYRDRHGHQRCRECHNMRHRYYRRGLPVPQEEPLL